MSLLTKDFGTKPVLPPWTGIDPTQNQQMTVAGNQAVLPSAEKLASSVNTFSLEELNRMFGLSSDTLKQIGANIGSQARGEIPKDVQDLLQNNAATRALAGGYGGTGMARNLTARDFGLTSMGIQQQGMDSAIKWMAASKANAFDVTSMFLTPTQRYSMASNERDLKFQHDYLQAQIDAMPDPAVRGIMDALRSTGIAYLGGSYQQGTDYTNPPEKYSWGKDPISGNSQGGDSPTRWVTPENSYSIQELQDRGYTGVPPNEDWSNMGGSYWNP